MKLSYSITLLVGLNELPDWFSMALSALGVAMRAQRRLGMKTRGTYYSPFVVMNLITDI